MNWRALTIALATLAPLGAAQAETIVARSGEHDGFSRLVMRLPAGADWSLTQNGRSAILNISGTDTVFDTSQVFNLIPRGRIANLSQAAAGRPLRIEMGCNCEVQSYVMANGYLVVDVRGQASGASQYEPESGVLPLAFDDSAEAQLDHDAIARSQFATNLASALASQAAPEKVSPQTPQVAKVKEQQAPIEPVEEAVETVETTAPPTPPISQLLNMEEASRAAKVGESERRLLQQIGRATNQGLLDLVVTEVNDGTTNFSLDPLGARDRPLNPLDHVAVTSSIDRETGLYANRPSKDAQEQLCLPNDDLAVHTWGSDKPFSEQIGAYRSMMVGEFDRFDESALRKLAKTYLFFGFGAEARMTLELLMEKPKGYENLLAMADLLDARDVGENNPFSGQQVCDGHAAFWAALSEGEVKKNADAEAIQLTYAKLPVHLRVHLGPRISTLFSQLGEKHMAEATLRSLERTGVEHVPELNLAEAALAELSGDTDTVADELTEEVAARSENTPQALIDLINLHFEERRALLPDIPELVASYEVENRETDLGAALRQAEVSALSLEGRFEDAFYQLGELLNVDGPVARAQATTPLFTLLTERANDITFLKYGLPFSNEATVPEATPVADIMAERFLALGFSEAAQSILKKLSLEEQTESRKLMMAKAALGMESPQTALDELSEMDGSEANQLRAQALRQNGDYKRAGEVLLAEQEADEAARVFWLSENYQAIDEIENAEQLGYGALASVTTEIDEIAKDPEGMPPLAEARALVESSVGTRDRIEDLLNRVSPEVEEE